MGNYDEIDGDLFIRLGGYDGANQYFEFKKLMRVYALQHLSPTELKLVNLFNRDLSTEWEEIITVINKCLSNNEIIEVEI